MVCNSLREFDENEEMSDELKRFLAWTMDE